MFRFLVALSGGACLLLTFLGHEALMTPGAVAVTHLGPLAKPAVAPRAISNTESVVLGLDDFSSATTQAWPDAPKGGVYSLLGPATDYSVETGAGTMRTPAGEDRGATLTGIRARDVDVRVRLTVDAPPTGGDEFVYVDLRALDEQTKYRARLRLDSANDAWLQFARTTPSSTQLLGSEMRVADVSNATAGPIWIRAATTGVQPVVLGLKAWRDGQPEPAWQYVTSDSKDGLSAPGAVGLETYVSSRATNAPVVFRFSDLRISAAAPDMVTVIATAEPTLAPTQAATPTSTPVTAADAWRSIAPALDAAWGHDTPLTVSLLDPYVEQFPDEAVARDKLYAALIAMARDAEAQGDMERASSALEKARSVLPTRGDAGIELLKLTPTPIVEPTPESVALAPTPTPMPPRAQVPPATAVQRAPVVAPRTNPRAPAAPAVPAAPAAPAARPPAPTPTKVPFVIPSPP